MPPRPSPQVVLCQITIAWHDTLLARHLVMFQLFRSQMGLYNAPLLHPVACLHRPTVTFPEWFKQCLPVASCPCLHPSWHTHCSWDQPPHATALILQIGESYETIGLDAILMMGHCGTNPMPVAGNMPRTACPATNVHAVIADLVAHNLTVVGEGKVVSLGAWAGE